MKKIPLSHYCEYGIKEGREQATVDWCCVVSLAYAMAFGIGFQE